jgi:hypothetical protein
MSTEKKTDNVSVSIEKNIDSPLLIDKTVDSYEKEHDRTIIYAQSPTGVWHLVDNGYCFCNCLKFHRWQTHKPKDLTIFHGCQRPILCYVCFRIVNHNSGNVMSNKKSKYLCLKRVKKPARLGERVRKKVRCSNKADPNARLSLCKLHLKKWNNMRASLEEQLPPDMVKCILDYIRLMWLHTTA